jgi:uncharacterized membrane protein
MAEPELVAFCNLAQPRHAPEDLEAGGAAADLLTEVDLLVAFQAQETSCSLQPREKEEEERDVKEPGTDIALQSAAAHLLDDGGGGGSSLEPEAESRPRRPPAARLSSSVVSFIAVTSTRVARSGGQLHAAGRDYCRRSLGLLVALLSGVLMVAYSSLIKILVEMDSMQVVIIRGVLQMTIFGAIALFRRLSFRGEASLYTLGMLTLVSVTGGLRMMFIFVSFARLPLGDSTAIIFSSPVFVMILSVCVLKAGYDPIQRDTRSVSPVALQ